MSKRNRHPKGGRTTPKGTRPPTRRPAEWDRREDQPDLMSDVLTRMRSDNPLDLLAHVGMLMTLVDKRDYGFGKRPGEPPYALDQLVEMFLDTWRIETSALLAVIVELAGARSTPDRSASSWRAATTGCRRGSATSATQRSTRSRRWCTCWATATTSTSASASPVARS